MLPSGVNFVYHIYVLFLFLFDNQWNAKHLPLFIFGALFTLLSQWNEKYVPLFTLPVTFLILMCLDMLLSFYLSSCLYFVSQASVILSRAACVAKGACMVKGTCAAKGNTWQRGTCVVKWVVCGEGKAGMHGRGHAWQGSMRGRRDSHCSGRYASYWNAFLFSF